MSAADLAHPQDIRAMQPDSYEAYYNCANIAIARGDYALAQELLADAERRSPVIATDGRSLPTDASGRRASASASISSINPCVSFVLLFLLRPSWPALPLRLWVVPSLTTCYVPNGPDGRILVKRISSAS